MKEKRITREELSQVFSPLPDRTNKGDMGRVLCVCSSYDMSGLSMFGAAYFCASGAIKSGAGIVEAFIPREHYQNLSLRLPEAVFSLYGYDENKDDVALRLKSSIQNADAVVIGCGLGKSEMSRQLLHTVLSNCSVPLVIDADALNIISEDERLWWLLSEETRKMTVITPHPGELSRLSGLKIASITGNIPACAKSFAAEKRINCLLKDHETAISDGEAVYINTSGNPGMACGGMGDVLSGILGALLARQKRLAQKKGEAFDILPTIAAAAFLHGRAGDIANEKTGEYSLTSSDLLNEISAAIKEAFAKN